jgi:hypothetical protein
MNGPSAIAAGRVSRVKALAPSQRDVVAEKKFCLASSRAWWLRSAWSLEIEAIRLS